MAKVKWQRVLLTSLIIITLLTWSSRLKTAEKEPTAQIMIRLYLHSSNKVVNLPLEEYLLGVVAAEMPAAFQQAALEAQAIAARTYILQKLPAVGGAKAKPSFLHQEADICDLPEHGQAWLDRSTLQLRWGTSKSASNYQHIQTAVKATEGMVLTYGGELIQPFYHASCGGLGTESSQDVWGKEIPYLTSVNCPENELAPKTKQQYQFSALELNKLLGTSLAAQPTFQQSRGGSSYEVLEQSPAGRVKTLRLGGKRLSGSFVRSQLKLASTRFTMQLAKGGAIRIETTGYGHAVGLCQRGADALAKQGAGYGEILAHYYPGTQLARIKLAENNNQP